MAKKTKPEIGQAVSAESASTPAVTPSKKAAPVKAKAGKVKTTAVRSNSKKVAEVTPEPAVEVAIVLPSVAPEVAVVHAMPAHDETELATQEVLDEREEIARIAYSYWVERRFAPGDPLHDWLRAEREFQVRRYASA